MLVCLHYYLLSCNVVNIVDLFLLLLLLLLLFYLWDVVKNVIASLFYFVFCRFDWSFFVCLLVVVIYYTVFAICEMSLNYLMFVEFVNENVCGK